MTNERKNHPHPTVDHIQTITYTRRKEHSMKQHKIKQTPKPQANEFVASISNVCGYDNDHNCIRLKNGFAAMIQIPGIDILNYKRNDQEYVYGTFGQATQVCQEPHKIVMLSDHADYTEQIEYLTMKKEKAAHPYRQYLLQRQIDWLQYYETSQNDRLAYLFFYAKAEEDASGAADLYIRTLRAGRNYAVRCDRKQCERVLRILLQGESA